MKRPTKDENRAFLEKMGRVEKVCPDKMAVVSGTPMGRNLHVAAIVLDGGDIPEGQAVVQFLDVKSLKKTIMMLMDAYNAILKDKANS